MRNVGNKTPTTRLQQKEEANLDKMSGKKLVQARLPFKIIAPISTPKSSTDSGTDGGGETAIHPSTDSGGEISSINEVRKRKLSYGEVSCDAKGQEEKCSPAKENLSTTRTKKKKINSTSTTAVVEDEVISLGDSDDESEKTAIVKKVIHISTRVAASPKTPTNKSQKRKSAGTPKSASALSSSGDCDGSAGGSSTKLKIKLPLSGKKKRRKSLRKSVTAETDGSHLEQSFAESGDDIEIVSAELNPQKRLKVEEGGGNGKVALVEEDRKQKESVDNKNVIAEKVEENDTGDDGKNSQHKSTEQIIKGISTKTEDATGDGKNSPHKSTTKSINKESKQTESIEKSDNDLAVTINIDSDSKNDKSSNKKTTLRTSKRNSLKILDELVAKKDTNRQQKIVNNDGKKVDSKKHNSSSSFKTSDLKSASAADDVETDDDDDANSSSSSNVGDGKQDSKSLIKNDLKVTGLPASRSPLPDIGVSSNQLKSLTPKQQRLAEQRKKTREDKERRLQEQKEERDRKQQEEKQQKQREKEEKELVKKREREEKEEQKRKEREEKEEIKRKDREDKERKRLAEIEAKNEERRKRNEAKEEELRKKEEERKRKEQEKEDAENKKKKAAEAFTKFFVPKPTQRLRNAGTDDEEQKVAANDRIEKPESDEALAFRPFQVKGDMQLAPICRKNFSDVARKGLDSFLCDNSKKAPQKTELYLNELKTGKMQPGKWRRPTVDAKEDDDDVVIVEDELERAAQAIVEEHATAVERYRAKFFKFHENRRPPYFGTWRKKTNLITPRRPLAQDNKYFDYEVDSDLEWEEEEPGESLDGSDDEKEKESEDDDYEVDNEWFVPHGHLSDEEMQNEDECGLGDDNTREAQKAKLKILQQEFAQEMKKKTEKIKPRLIGCIWQDYNGNQPELCPNIIWNSLNLRAMICTSAPITEEPIVTESTNDTVEPNSPTASSSGQTDKKKPIALTEKMLKELIRLVHGNRHKKDFIIKEFIAFVEQSEESIKNGDVRGPLKSVVREKIDEFALWQIIELNSNTKKKKNKKKLCWLVSDEILKKYDMHNLDLHNAWTYTLQPKFVDAKIVHSDNNSAAIEEDLVEATTALSEKGSSTSLQKKIKNKKPDVITKFTKVLTAEDKAQHLQQKSESPKVSLAAKSPNVSKPAKSPMLGKKTESNNSHQTAAEPKAALPVSAVKKRVPLLMSVARGQQISTPAKNALISQFLRKSKEEANEKADLVSKSKTPVSSPMEIDDIVVLD